MADARCPEVEALGTRILLVRVARGLTQAELGDAIGLEKSAISKYEKGRRGISLCSIVAIADALGVDVQSLLFGDIMLKAGGV